MSRAYLFALLLLSSCDSSLFGSFRTAKSDCEQAGIVCPAGTVCGKSPAGDALCVEPKPPCMGLDLFAVSPNKFLKSSSGVAHISVANLPPDVNLADVGILVGDQPATQLMRLSSTDIQFNLPPAPVGDGRVTVPLSVSIPDGRCGQIDQAITYFPFRYDISSEPLPLTGLATALAAGPTDYANQNLIAVATRLVGGGSMISLWSRGPTGALAESTKSIMPTSDANTEIIGLGFGDVNNDKIVDLVAMYNKDTNPLRGYSKAMNAGTGVEVRSTSVPILGKRTAMAVGRFDSTDGDDVVMGLTPQVAGQPPILVIATWDEAAAGGGFRETQVPVAGLPLGDIIKIVIGDFTSGDFAPDLMITVLDSTSKQRVFGVKRNSTTNLNGALTSELSASTTGLLPLLEDQVSDGSKEAFVASTTQVTGFKYNGAGAFDAYSTFQSPIATDVLSAVSVPIDRLSPLDFAVLGRNGPAVGLSTGVIALFRGGQSLSPIEAIPFPMGLGPQFMSAGLITDDAFADLVLIVDPLRPKLWVLPHNGLE